MSEAVAIGRRAVLGGLIGLPAGLARAQGAGPYPTRPIKVFVGVPPGGSTDAQTRLIAGWLQDDLGQPAIPENRPGANTSLAAHAVAQAPPDGHTILVATDAYITVPLLVKIPYDPFTSLTPVTSFSFSPFIYVVHPSTPIHSIGDLVAFARANPGKLHYGSSGSGGASHVGAEKFKLMTGTNIVHVPYRGAGPALVDALSGQYQLSLWTSLAAAGYIRDGRLRALAVTSPTRLPSLPDVPTFAEAGLPGVELATWNMLLAPKPTAPERIDHVGRAVRAALASEALRARLATAGTTAIADASSDQTGRYLAAQIEGFRAVAKAARIELAD